MKNKFKYRTPIYTKDEKFRKFVYWNSGSEIFPPIAMQKGDTLEEPEQYTKFEDCNNVPIYEGDIVEVLTKGNKIAIIELHNIDAVDNTFLCTFKDCKGSDLKIIGNVHENPELLEE